MARFHIQPNMAIKLKIYDSFNRVTHLEKQRIAQFLHKHLEQYGDELSAITKAIEYTQKERSGLGGKVITALEGDTIVGATVVNKTGMTEYIPENILVYIATHGEHRGKGIGKKLIEAVKTECKGSIALHVEHDNPAKHLYEKLGFTNPYLEMRLMR